MNETLNEAANLVGPAKGSVLVLAITTSSASQGDLSTAALLGEGAGGHILALLADGGDVYVMFSADATGTVDETATGIGATTAWKIPSGTYQEFKMPRGKPYLIAKGSATCKLRVYVSSRYGGA